LLVVVRGLAAWIDQDSAREALEGLLEAQTQSFAAQLSTSTDPATQEALGLARVRLAREMAAIALASSGHAASIEKLLAAGRSGGPAQEPALQSLALFPPDSSLLGGVALTTPGAIGLAAATGDLRSLDAIEGVLAASDPLVRSAALAALGLAGDWRVRPTAREALRDHDPRVRVAGADALTRLGAPEAAAAVEQLITDDATARNGLQLAQWVQGPGVVRAASARAAASDDDATRSAALVALGRQTDPLAVDALVALTNDARLASEAADALAHSPASAALSGIVRLGAAQRTRRLALRAYFVRRSVRDERSPELDALLDATAAAVDPVDRAVATQVRVGFGLEKLAVALGDRDVRVQRAGAMGALSLSAETRARIAAEGLPRVHDEATLQVLAFVTCASRVAASTLSTRDLIERARGGGTDAPLAAMVLAGREEVESEIDDLLTSTDPLLRSHVARGLGMSPASNATGRLAHAYAFETQVDVRRAVIAAIAQRVADADAPARRETLAFAAQLDPDPTVRWLASHADGAIHPSRPTSPPEVAWVRLVAEAGASLPFGSSATLTGADGLARPIIFDEEGHALVGGVPAGGARLRLASRVAAYEAR
jgi:HEAT repeat protein